jgi:hypothetical protein
MMAPPSVMISARPPRWALDSSRLDPRVPISDADRNRACGDQANQETRERESSVLRRGWGVVCCVLCVLWRGGAHDLGECIRCQELLKVIARGGAGAAFIHPVSVDPEVLETRFTNGGPR